MGNKERDQMEVNRREEEGELSLLPASGNVLPGMESSEGAPKEEEAHPCLFIDNVLDLVFKHIIHQPGPGNVVQRDVHNIRQVCKSWKSSVTRLYRGTQEETTFYEYGTLAQFVGTMRASQMIPVQKFTFCASTFREHGDLKMFREFLVICGPEMVSLTMYLPSSSGVRIVRDLGNLADLEMRKLETLELRICEDYTHHQTEMKANQVHGTAKLMELLLMAAGTLWELELSYPPFQSTPYRARQKLILQQLSGVIAKMLPSSVRQLKLSLQMDEFSFNDLAGIQSKLERVELKVSSVLGTGTLYRFLQNQAASLKRLEIHKLPESWSAIIAEFPRLDELVHLEWPTATVTVTGPDFAGTFPKLEWLKIGSMKADTAFVTLLSNAKKPAPSLKVLHLPSWSSTELAPLVKGLSSSFPCLTELRIRLHHNHGAREAMEEVFKYFDRLESLHVHFSCWLSDGDSNWVESILSGKAEADCARIKELPDFDNENIDHLRHRPSLLNLSRLRKLHWESDDDWITFTDFAAHFVFMEMANLREVHLPHLAVQFSPEYMELLRGKLVLEEEE